MKDILFIRHAEGIANAEGILMGSSKVVDKGLSEKGEQMAISRAKKIQHDGFNPEKVFCSELPRALQTARIIIATLSMQIEPIVVPELNERSFGVYEGKPYQDVIDAFNIEGVNPQTVENVNEFINRVLEGFQQVRKKTKKSSLVVTHSNPLAVIRSHLYYPDDIDRFWEHETDNYVNGFKLNL